MAYATGTASSWGALRSAMSTFCVTTLGTYTEEYDDGVSINNVGASGECLALKHTASGMFYFWDSGPGNDASYGTSGHGPTGQYFIVGMMGTAANDGECIGRQSSGAPHSSIIGNTQVMGNGGAPRCEYVDFDSGITYHFFGDTPGTGGEDYFHMVLEIQTNLYSNWWTGQVTGLITEMASPYGGFMGCSGPHVSNNINFSNWHFPLSGLGNENARSIMYFHEGDSAGQIDVSNGRGTTFNNLAPNTNWTSNCTALSGRAGLSGMGWSGRTETTGRTGLDGVIATVTADPSTYGYNNDTTYSPNGGTRVVPVGMIPGVYTTTLDALTAGAEFTVSTDTFKVFPALKRDVLADSLSHPTEDLTTNNTSIVGGSRTVVDGGMASGLWGIGYKKTT